MWDLIIYLFSVPSILADTHHLVSIPLQGPVSLPTHHSVSGSYIICISSNPTLAYIVFFGFSFSGFLSKFLKHVCYEEISNLQGPGLSIVLKIEQKLK